MTTVTVGSILALKTALANNAFTEIVVLNGTYHVSPSNAVATDSLWIGSTASGGYDYPGRTNPVLVRAETVGGVTFDGGGGSGYGALSFEAGAHHQTWRGFKFANMVGTATGVIEFGGYTPRAAPHHITIDQCTVMASCHRASSGSGLEHAVYFAHATAPDGPHHITFTDFTVEATDSLRLYSALHFFHGDTANPGTTDVLVDGMTVNGTKRGIIFWNETLRRITIRDATITNPEIDAVVYEGYGEENVPGAHADDILLDNVNHSGTGSGITTTHDYLGLTITGGNLGETGGGSTGETGGGTGGTSGGAFPGGSGFDSDHWYSFRFGGPEDAGWSSDGVSADTSFSDNTDGALFQDGTLYHVHIEMSQTAGGGGPYAPSFWIGPDHSTSNAIIFDTTPVSGDLPGTGSFTHDHDFTTGFIDNVARMQAHASAAGDHSHAQTMTVSGWVDPDGWTPIPPAPPDPGPEPPAVYDPDDVLLTTLGEAFDVKVRIELNAPGWGRFSINRHSSEAVAEAVTPGNYVRFAIPQIDPDPLFGFFLEGSGAPETPSVTVVSQDEEGGENITMGGRGGLAYWDRAIWLNESFLRKWWPQYLEDEHGAPPAGSLGAVGYAPGPYRRFTVSGGAITSRIDGTSALGFSSYYDQRKRFTYNAEGDQVTLVHLTTGGVAGWWVKPYGARVKDYPKKSVYAFGPSVLMSTLSTNKTPGEVIYAMYQEAIAADRPIHPLPLMTVDFDDTTDSNGDPWTVTDALDGVSAELGDDYLSTIGKLVNTGAVDVVMDPDLGMHAYNSYGRDLTSTVRFAKGVNIADTLQRDYSDAPVGTWAEVLGNQDGVIARVDLPDSAERAPREISVRGDSTDTDVLEALGLAELEARLLHSDAIGFNVATPIVGQEDPDNGLYLPGPPGSAHGDYWIGDLVTLHTGTGEHDFNEAVVRIVAITLQFSDANSLQVSVEVNSGFGGYQSIGGSSGSSTSTTGGTTSTLSDLYQLVSQLDQPNGYPSLNDDGLIDPSELPPIESLTTDETDTSLVLAPDGSGGLAFVTGGVSMSSPHWKYVLDSATGTVLIDGGTLAGIEAWE